MHKALIHALKKQFDDRLELFPIDEKCLKAFQTSIANTSNKGVYQTGNVTWLPPFNVMWLITWPRSDNWCFEYFLSFWDFHLKRRFSFTNTSRLFSDALEDVVERVFLASRSFKLLFVDLKINSPLPLRGSALAPILVHIKISNMKVPSLSGLAKNSGVWKAR